MLLLINALLDLWDPYEIYLFPKDEYTSYAIKIQKFLETEKNIDCDVLADFVFEILPPLTIPDTDLSIAIVEYERFAKAILLAVRK